MKTVAGTVVAASGLSQIKAGAARATAEQAFGLDSKDLKNLADLALRTAKKLGAGYADIRFCRYENEHLNTREKRVQSIHNSRDGGFGVRVLWRGTWGFASSNQILAASIEGATRAAVEMAKANHVLQHIKIELEKIPSYEDEWVMPMRKDPFTVPLDEKVKKLLALNEAAMKAGADFCSSSLSFVKEEKIFASSYGSFIRQVRVRSFPDFTATAVDKTSGRFVTRSSFAAPRGSGYEYVEQYDLVGEAAQAGEEARKKLLAKSVEPGVKDLVVHPTNLWLTIHESVGHPTELDRALAYEANFAGTSFVTTDKLGKLRYGSDLVNIVGDRTQKDGLATVAYDDDGVKTKGAEFDIIRKGVFKNYQLSIGFAHFVGRKKSNGCAFADSWDKAPMQRMPNISLQPGEKKVSAAELISGVQDGIYILGNGSWSIDHQRYNFQFGGQVFYEIKNGRLGQMLRDVAYQSNTVEFWNGCDGLGGREEYFLGGAFNCGKAQPMQIAPVSHGAVPARFRKISVINTNRET
jgi:TldD protein